MPRIRFVLFTFYMAVATILIGLVALPTLFRRSWAMGLSRLWCRTLLFGLRSIGGIAHEITGREHLPEGPALVASKHQSMWETMVLHLSLPAPAFILKKELGDLPFFGWWTKACGFVHVDRSAGAAALKDMVSQAKETLAKGASHLVIFPEGTRVLPGEEGTYQPGVAALAKALNLPVVPAAHNSGSHWQTKNKQLLPGKITLAFLPSVPGDTPRKTLMAELKDRIEGKTRALEAGSVGTDAPPDTPPMESRQS